jgi:predicted hotdog family 3-hydroxylacyl-ACP dehydratase
MSSTIEELIPHRTPMRFIDALTDCTDTTANALAHFSADHFAVANGRVLEAALVECVAQTVAAALGQRAKNRGQSGSAANNGMLVAVTNFQIQARPLAEKELHIEIRELKRLGPMLMISSQIFCEGQAVASGELTLYA